MNSIKIGKWGLGNYRSYMRAVLYYWSDLARLKIEHSREPDNEPIFFPEFLADQIYEYKFGESVNLNRHSRQEHQSWWMKVQDEETCSRNSDSVYRLMKRISGTYMNEQKLKRKVELHTFIRTIRKWQLTFRRFIMRKDGEENVNLTTQGE